MSVAHLPLHPQGDRFVPSQAQRRFLEQAHAGERHKSISELLLNSDLPRSTYYRWAQDPGFRNWFAKGFAARQLFEGWHLINIARRKAADNFQYWKALRDLTFDPNGYALLQGWSESCASASLDEAHDLGPDDDSEFMDKLVLPPEPRFDFATWSRAFASLQQSQGVPPSTESDQSLTPENGTDPAQSARSGPAGSCNVRELAPAPDSAARDGANGVPVPREHKAGSAQSAPGPAPKKDVPRATEQNQSVAPENGTVEPSAGREQSVIPAAKLSSMPSVNEVGARLRNPANGGDPAQSAGSGPTSNAKPTVPRATEQDQPVAPENGTNPARSYDPRDRPIYEPWHSSVPPKF